MIKLLDACVNNCGKTFHLEIASRDFEAEYKKLISKSHPIVQQKLKELLKVWAEGEFKSDPQLNLIPSLFTKLKLEGVDFNPPPDMVSVLFYLFLFLFVITWFVFFQLIFLLCKYNAHILEIN